MRIYLNTILILVCSLMLFSCRPIDLEREIKEASGAAKKGDWKTALEKAETCLDNVPSHPDAALLKGLALFNLHGSDPAKTAMALDNVKRVTQEHPERYDAWFIYGWILFNSNHINDSIYALRKAYELQMKPENAKNVTQVSQGAIMYTLGQACLMNNLSAEADKMLQLAAKRTPYNSWASIASNIGYIKFYGHKYKESLSWMNKALKMRPNDYAIALNMAVIVDILSYEAYNKENPGAFADKRKGWYQYALKLINTELARTNNANMQVYLNNLKNSITARLARI